MDLDRIRRELQRFQKPPTQTESPGGVGVVRFVARCPLGAEHVLRDAKTIHKLVLSNALGRWPEVLEWRQILPPWFVDACPPPLTCEEAERQLQKWRDLSPQEQAETENEKEWSLEDWLYWMEPENRQWTWWDAQIVPGCDHILVAVEVDCWPFPWGALRWLFKASGASGLEPER